MVPGEKEEEPVQISAIQAMFIHRNVSCLLECSHPQDVTAQGKAVVHFTAGKQQSPPTSYAKKSSIAGLSPDLQLLLLGGSLLESTCATALSNHQPHPFHRYTTKTRSAGPLSPSSLFVVMATRFNQV